MSEPIVYRVSPVPAHRRAFCVKCKDRTATKMVEILGTLRIASDIELEAFDIRLLPHIGTCEQIFYFCSPCLEELKSGSTNIYREEP